MPLALILLGIIQFGFIFNTYITVSNATRDAARLGTVYMYDSDCTKDENDLLRNEAIRKAVISSMSQINTTSPRFTTTAPTSSTACAWSGGWSQSGTTFTNGDVVITYTLPTGITDSDARTGQQLTVQAAYHQDLIVPLVSTILPKDAGGRLTLTGVVTMVID